MKKADLIILSPVIFTGFQDETVSGMIAVTDGIIEYVGSMNYFDHYKGEKTVVIESNEGMVVPGFHDAHIHLFLAALYDSGRFYVCKGDKSEEDCVKSLENMVGIVDRNQWILAAGWYHPIWKPRELPTKKLLDRSFINNPVCFLSEDCHSLWINQIAKERLQIDYEKEVVHDMEALLLLKEIMYQANIDEKECVRTYIQKLNQFGITSVCDMAIIPDEKEDFVKNECYKELLSENDLNIRIHMYPALTDNLKRVHFMKEKYNHSKLRFSGVKQFYDGVSSCHTAFLKQAYSNAAYKNDRGNSVISKETAKKRIEQANLNLYSIRTHTIGDQAVSDLIELYDPKENKRTYYNVLEHLENIDLEEINKISSNRIVASVQPQHLILDIDGVIEDLGKERLYTMWPFHTMIKQNVILAFGSDAPVVSGSVMETLSSAVTRRENSNSQPFNEDECITMEEALSAHTYGSACAANRNHSLGLLKKGYLADLVILDQNLLLKCNRTNADRIIETNVIYTILDGKIVYEKNMKKNVKMN